MIRVNFILGFLGAGKTTFIKSLLHKGVLGNEQIALVVNDYGPENYDSDLLRETGTEIVEITNGCLCCSNQHDFHGILQDLSQRKDIDRIIIEPSGLFMPDQVIPELKRGSLNATWQIEPMCVLVDMAFLANATRPWPPFISRHIEIADYIITNKQEHLPARKAIDIVQKLVQINGQAEHLNFNEASNQFNKLKHQPGHIPESNNDGHHGVKLEVRIDFSFKSEDELKQYLEAESPSLLRAKGYVKVAGKQMRVNYTQTSFEVMPANESAFLSLSCFHLSMNE